MGTVADLKSRGVSFDGEVQDHGYGMVTYFTIPGGIRVQLYEPRYQKRASKPAAAKAKAAVKKVAARAKASAKKVAKKPAPKAKPAKKKAARRR